ncbi:cellulose synthase (UDP-forming) [Klenkia soli]|uniref:Cellulose synthase (UDP-forming) n=1 Tax=Klenkia soli TaxID=1052260 RepID=A0A1H0UU90_9ACTN|nr:glycosyltransferase family 2 protein [Klenkia soli]SDP69671.1 cellulose synthase (UDP-forming) [Klenkia soli]
MPGTTQPTGSTRFLAWRPLQRSTRLAILLALLATASYQMFLLDPSHRGNTWLWLAMIAAELITAAAALGTWWTILAHDDRSESADVTVWRNRLRSTETPPTIDVFITACGEPVGLIAATVRAARDMQLAHETFVLDDGDDDELQAVCADLGVHYLRRGGSLHAKAGNVNAALARTRGEMVVVFDADHVPDVDFLIQVLPHFVDPAVAFVQSPQFYDNRVNIIATGASEAQRMFYELVCPGKNHFNAAFCVGTNVMFRRAALDEIGGIWTGSNSEDIWTSLELHRRGWRSVYVPQVLSHGLAPEEIEPFLKQQLRWASGGFEILLRGKLFRRSGLTLDQRLQYLFTGLHYTLSISMLIFMALPAAYLLFGLSPINVDGWTWATHYIPYLVMTFLVAILQAGGLRGSAIVTSIASSWVHARALVAVLLRRRATWSATNASGRVGGNLWSVFPHAVLMTLNAAGIVVGFTVMADPATTYLSAFWAGLNVLLLGRIVREGLRRGPATAVDEDHTPLADAPSAEPAAVRTPGPWGTATTTGLRDTASTSGDLR